MFSTAAESGSEYRSDATSTLGGLHSKPATPARSSLSRWPWRSGHDRCGVFESLCTTLTLAPAR